VIWAGRPLSIELVDGSLKERFAQYLLENKQSIWFGRCTLMLFKSTANLQLLAEWDSPWCMAIHQQSRPRTLATAIALNEIERTDDWN
jgi:hypothetical protein